jgi:hypothetical protein
MSSFDPVLFKLNDPLDLKELQLRFDDVTRLLIDDGIIKLLFVAPYPLSSVFCLVTDDPSGVSIYDARSWQRDNLSVRVTFLTGAGQEVEFWAKSVELAEDGA